MDELDALTLDQIRVFLTVVREGSFSAAARRLKRAQSAVSYAVANLERMLEVQLFDRSSRTPALTNAGRALISDAEEVLGRVDLLRARARGLAGGLESQVSIAIDVMCPMEAVLPALREFQQQHPTVTLRLQSEALGAVVQQLVEDVCELGISGPLESWPRGIVKRRLVDVRAFNVASPNHPLGKYDRPIPLGDLQQHTQIVITDRSRLTEGFERNVLSHKTWRVADLPSKLEILRAGFGWGSLPHHLIEDEIASGRLSLVQPEEWPTEGTVIPLYEVYRSSAPPGPAGRWLLDRLATELDRTLTKPKSD